MRIYKTVKYLSSIFYIFFIYLNAAAQSDDPLIINYSYINTIPQNAEVYINDELAGNTPYRFTRDMIDTSKVSEFRIKMKGYIDFVLKVEPSTLPLNKTITLVPLNLLTKKKEIVTEDKAFYFKTPRKIAPIVISGVVTAGSVFLSYYFKTLANDNYDEYLQTGDQSKLDNTKKYDLYSGIGLVAFQVGLAGLIYFLLID